MSNMISITVDGKTCEVGEGTILLDALRSMDVSIPMLCHHPSLEPNGACRLCTVEIGRPDWNGWTSLVTSCLYPASPDLIVSTNSPRVKALRQTLLELYLARCPDSEELKSLALAEGVEISPFTAKQGADKCVLCGLCTRVCQDLGPAAIAPLGRGAEKIVGPAPDMVGEDCTGCGACAFVCPTGEIRQEYKDGKTLIWNRAFDVFPCCVNPDRCIACGECGKACPLAIPKAHEAPGGRTVYHIDPIACIGCGLCAGACPKAAIEQDEFPDGALAGEILDAENLKGRTVVFACSRSPFPTDAGPDVIRVPCIGRVSIEHMLACLARGADGVLLLCRDQETCPTGSGGAAAELRAQIADGMAAKGGLGSGRIQCVKPAPGAEGPAAAVSAFEKSLSPSPLVETYPRGEGDGAGMDRAEKIVEWLKERPELSPPKRLGRRRITQIASLLLLHSSLWTWAQAKWLCNPVLSCHSCPLAWFACPIGVFVHYSGYRIFPFLALGTVLLLGVFFARLLCGWVCPFGFLQDMLYKIRTPKFSLPAWSSHIRWGVLILGVFLLPFFLGEQTYFSFCRICPAAAMQSTIPNLISTGGSWLQPLVMVKLGALVFFLLLVIFSNRAFCKTVCPIGAILAPLNYLSFWKIKIPTRSCMHCSLCDKSCPPSGAPSSRISSGKEPSRALDCLFCYECTSHCPMAGIKETPKVQETAR